MTNWAFRTASGTWSLLLSGCFGLICCGAPGFRPRLYLRYLAMVFLLGYFGLLVHLFSLFFCLLLSSCRSRFAARMKETAFRADIPAPERLQPRSAIVAIVPVFIIGNLYRFCQKLQITVCARRFRTRPANTLIQAWRFVLAHSFAGSIVTNFIC